MYGTLQSMSRAALRSLRRLVGVCSEPSDVEPTSSESRDAGHETIATRLPGLLVDKQADVERQTWASRSTPRSASGRHGLLGCCSYRS